MDAEITGAMGRWRLSGSPTDPVIREILKEPSPKEPLPNLKKNANTRNKLDKLRSKEGKSRRVYLDAWRDTRSYEEQKSKVTPPADPGRDRQSRAGRAEAPHERAPSSRRERSVRWRAKSRGRSLTRDEPNSKR